MHAWKCLSVVVCILSIRPSYRIFTIVFLYLDDIQRHELVIISRGISQELLLLLLQFQVSCVLSTKDVETYM